MDEDDSDDKKLDIEEDTASLLTSEEEELTELLADGLEKNRTDELCRDDDTLKLQSGRMNGALERADKDPMEEEAKAALVGEEALPSGMLDNEDVDGADAGGKNG